MNIKKKIAKLVEVFKQNRLSELESICQSFSKDVADQVARSFLVQHSDLLASEQVDILKI